MSDQSMSGLEQRAEDIRSQVVDTAESLREKMTGGHLVDDLMSNETVSAATDALSSSRTHDPIKPRSLCADRSWLGLGDVRAGTAVVFVW